MRQLVTDRVYPCIEGSAALAARTIEELQ
jgi:hypothetical protein